MQPGDHLKHRIDVSNGIILELKAMTREDVAIKLPDIELRSLEVLDMMELL